MSADPENGGAVAATRREDESMRDVGSDLAKLVLAYAKQETLDPLKALGRFALFGVLGAVFTVVGGLLLSLAFLRALQTEFSSTLSGNLSWVPYVGAIAVASAFVLVALTRMLKTPR